MKLHFSFSSQNAAEVVKQAATEFTQAWPCHKQYTQTEPKNVKSLLSLILFTTILQLKIMQSKTAETV